MIGVTGTTGALGGSVARLVAAAGRTQRLLASDPARAPHLPGATAVSAGRYGDREASLQALRGVQMLFMVSAHESIDRVAQHYAFVDAAAEAGVQHIVYTSFIGAAPNATFTLARDHWATEERIRSSGMHFTVLRDNLYQDVLPHFAGEEGVIRGPAGQGRLAAVARRDVARVAATVLLNPAAHTDATCDLTGPEALTLDEIARTLSDVTGRPVRFHDETVEEAYASRARYNAPRWQVEAWVSTYLAIRNGEMEAVSDAVAAITGARPLTLREFLRGSG